MRWNLGYVGTSRIKTELKWRTQEVLEQEMNTAAVFLHLINMCWGKSPFLMLFLIVFRVTWTLFTYVKHVTSVTCIAHDTAVMSMETLSGFSLSFSDTEEWNVLQGLGGSTCSNMFYLLSLRIDYNSSVTGCQPMLHCSETHRCRTPREHICMWCMQSPTGLQTRTGNPEEFKAVKHTLHAHRCHKMVSLLYVQWLKKLKVPCELP